MIKLKSILDKKEFEDFSVVAGAAGLDRDVTTVSVMDAPDIYKWMKGGEFLITSGYVVKDHPEYIPYLIESLEKAGASALGVKFDRFIHAFSREALDKADDLEFPIISIPYEFAFTDIINPVLQEVVNNQAEKMMYTEDIHNAFTKMVLENEDIPSILKFLRKHIHREVAFLDSCFEKIYFANEEHIGEIKRSLSESVDKGETFSKIIRDREHYKAHIDQEEYGYILFGEKLSDYDEEFEDYYKIAIEQAGTVLILKIQKMIAAAQVEADYREQFIHDMIMGNVNSTEEIYNRATIYNWDFYAGGIVVIIDIDNFKKQYLENLDRHTNQRMEATMRHILNVVKAIMHAENIQYVYSKLSDQIILIISEKHAEEQKFINRIRHLSEEIKNEISRCATFTATVGVGGYREDIGQIRKSYKEARKAIEISRSMNQEDIVVVYDELGVMKILSMISGSVEAESFQRQYIAELEHYDKSHNTELLKTLLVLVSTGWNLKKASEKLFIHYNSMKYRYQKICHILQLNEENQDQRINVELALKLYQINHKI